MTHVINTLIGDALAADFTDFVRARKNGVTKYFDGFTADDIQRATYAFARTIDAKFDTGNTALTVGNALRGVGLGDESETRASAKAGFIFINEFAGFDKITRVKTDSYSVTDGVAKYNRGYRYIPGKRSRITSVLGSSGPSSIGLRAERFSDYGADGYNADGQSIYLRGKHRSEQVAASTIAGVNAVQGQSYDRNGTIDFAADVYAALAERLKGVNSAARKTARQYVTDLIADGNAEPGTINEFEEASETKIAGLAAGTKFIVDNGRGYIRYAIDQRGRQYAVGTFNHFDTGVLIIVLETRHIAEEIVEDAGKTTERSVAALRDFLGGKDRALNYFFKREKGVTRSGKVVYATRFDHSLFAAAITLAA